MALTTSTAELLNYRWSGIILKHSRIEDTFTGQIPDYSSQIVRTQKRTNVLQIAERDTRIDVVRGPLTFPRSASKVNHKSMTIDMNPLYTALTQIQDDDIQELPYLKLPDILQQHVDRLREQRAKFTAHSLAPATATDGAANGRIQLTTGSTDGESSTAHKKIQFADLSALMFKMKKSYNVDPSEVMFLLSDKHFFELAETSETFERQFLNLREGEVLRYLGMNFIRYSGTPTYASGGALNAWDSNKDTIGQGDRECSLAVYRSMAYKALGDVMLYDSGPSLADPHNEARVIGLKQFYESGNLTKDGNPYIGAIIEDTV